MIAFIGVISFFGFIVFGIITLVSLVKKKGKIKNKSIITGVCFVVFIFSFALDPSVDSTAKDNNNPNVDKKSNENINDNQNEEEKKKEETENDKDEKKKEKEVKAAKKDKKEKKEKQEKEKKAAKENKKKENKNKNDNNKNDNNKKKDKKSALETIQDERHVESAKLDDDGMLTIKIDESSALTVNFIVDNARDILDDMHTAFKDKKVDEVYASIDSVLVDNKGNESTEEVVKLSYKRDGFEELNYEKFSKMSVSEPWRIYNESTSYFIHPAIYDELKSKYKDGLQYGKSKVEKIEE